MSDKFLFILSMTLFVLVACNLATVTPTARVPTAAPDTSLATFVEPTVGFHFDYPSSLTQANPIGTMPYLVTFANFDIMDEAYITGGLEYPVDAQIIELTVAELPEALVTLDDMQARAHESFNSLMFLGATLNREDRRTIGGGLEANVYYITLREGTETIMAETMLNGFMIYFRAFGGDDVIDTILNSMVIE